jgi:hypothetical protein
MVYVNTPIHIILKNRTIGILQELKKQHKDGGNHILFPETSVGDVSINRSIDEVYNDTSLGVDIVYSSALQNDFKMFHNLIRPSIA